MQFHPEHLLDTNRGENFVWHALKEALGELLGDAFHRFPIVGLNGFAAYEPDILLVRPNRVPLVIECKGCRIDHVQAVHGSLWIMDESWNRPQERPLLQARDQAVALRRKIKSRGGRLGAVPSLVALPFVGRADWLKKFGNEAGIDGMLFAEDFSHEALRRAVAARMDASPVDEGCARCIAEFVGAEYQAPGAPLPPPRPGRPDGTGSERPICLLRYTGAPPSAAQLREAIGLEPDTSYTYLVATAALERHRRGEGLGGDHQVAKDLRPEADRPEETLLLFHRALRHFIGQPLLGRAEERTLIQRAIRDLAQQDKCVAEQLRHDVFAWRDVLAELEEAGIDINLVDPAHDDDWAHPDLRRVAGQLQAAYRRQRRAAGRGKSTFEEATRQYLAHGYRPTPVIVLEGFTRLTHLQRYFIETCAACPGIRIWIVQPHRIEQAEGFAAINKTYGHLLEGVEIRQLETAPLSDAPVLHHLQESMFSTKTMPFGGPIDGSVQVMEFPHQNDEVASCVDQVIAALEDSVNPLRPADIAIVCSDPLTVGALLRDEAELRDRPELFAVQPRQLLLTPVGRFVLTLYEIWGPSGLRLAPEQFAALLGSGWLGAAAQQGTDDFLAVAAQHFANCCTEAEWLQALDRITAYGPSARCALGSLYYRLPESLVDSARIAHWRAILSGVVKICRRLFQRGERPISVHIAQLLDEIERLDPHRILVAEREVLESIREEFRTLAAGSSIAVEAAEFGEVLSGLIRERAEKPEEDAPGPTGQRIWVVGPEGVDNVTRDTVFFLSVDDRRVPAPGLPPWPRMVWTAKEHVERQRYRFLAVLRAAQRKLCLSYAKQDWQMAYRRSIYLEEVLRLVPLPPATRPPLPTLAAPVLTPEPARRTGPVHRPHYDIGELAVFRLCPHRYQLEMISRPARCYADPWKLEWVARGVWLAMAFDRLVATHPGVQDAAAIAEALPAALEAVRPAVQERFAGLAKLSWTTIGHDVRGQAAYMLNPSGERKLRLFGIGPALDPAPSKEISFSEVRSVTITAAADYTERRGRYINALRNTNQTALWLRYGPRDAPEAEADLPEMHVFRRQYDAVTWWRSMNLTLSKQQPLPDADANELRDTVLQVQRGAFPKNPGEHCRYCPVHDSCMGLPP
jgi:hypothetical protein